MTLVLPTPVGSAADGWRLANWTSYSAVSAAAAGGVCSASFDNLDPDEMWLVDRAVVSCPTGTAATELRLYDGAPDVSRLLSGTDRGSFDEADYPTGLLVEGGRSLVAQWTNVPDGAVGQIRVQVRAFRRSS